MAEISQTDWQSSTNTIRKHTANILTGLRIICSITLLFLPALSIPFYSFYILAGLTDVLDGIVARRLQTASRFGRIFDTIADICFAGAWLIKLIPLFDIPVWLWVWLIVILLIKAANLILGWIVQKTMVAEHTIMNKVTGILLFLFPFAPPIVDFEIGAVVLCVAATIAAIQEGYCILRPSI